MDICTTIDPDTGREVASMWKDEFLHLVESHNKLLSWAERQGHGDPCGVWDDSVPNRTTGTMMSKDEKDATERFPVKMCAQGHSYVDINKELREGYRICLIEKVYPLMVELTCHQQTEQR